MFLCHKLYIVSLCCIVIVMVDVLGLEECPACASKNVVHSVLREQVICRDCGNIFEPLSPGAEEDFERVAGIDEEGSSFLGRSNHSTKKPTPPVKTSRHTKIKSPPRKKISPKKSVSKKSGKKKR